MYWLDNDSGVTTPPAIPPVVSATRQYFTEGGGGDQPSIPGGEWFNMMTDELLAVLAEAGIVPNKANHAQLLAAITAIFVKKSGGAMSGPLALAAGSTAPNPTTGTRSTAIATMQKFADEFGASIVGNGYQKLPSGLIIQWGKITLANVTQLSATFPIAFPTACLSVTTNVSEASGNYAFGQAVSPSTTGFMAVMYTAPPGSAPVTNTTITADLYWIAIGW